MKKILLSILSVVFFLTFFSSCKNLVPYTDAMRKNHNWSDGQVQSIQFYVSDDVILHRELTGGSTEIIKGKIKIIDGKKVEEIFIRKGTPGVVIGAPKTGKLLVSFETDEQCLSFGVNPNLGEKYVLLASDWSNGIGRIHYSDNEYYTNPESKYTHLLVDLRKIMKMDVTQRVAKGRKVNR